MINHIGLCIDCTKRRSDIIGASHSKGKRFERDTGKWALEHDGECPKWQQMASSTARVGHITELQFDVISRSYAAECKHRKSVPKWLMEAWEQVLDKANEHDKAGLLAIKKNYKPVIHCITPERHQELLRYERECLGD